MGKKCPECKPGVPGWVLTYGDTMSLLLCFFILLLSFANMDAKKFNAAAGSIQESLRGKPNPQMSHNQASFITRDFQHRIQLVETMEELKMVMKDAVDSNNASVADTEEGLVLTLEAEVLFGNGWTVKPDMADKLREVANILHIQQNIIQVTGHTDRSDGSGPEGAENGWFISANYAAAVASILDETGLLDPQQLEARGLADRHPVTVDDAPVSRKKNRRVEIRLSQHRLGQ